MQSELTPVQPIQPNINNGLEDIIFSEFKDYELLIKLGFSSDEFFKLSFTKAEINFVAYIKDARNTAEDIEEAEAEGDQDE